MHKCSQILLDMIYQDNAADLGITVSGAHMLDFKLISMSCSFQGKINNPHFETTLRFESGGQSHGWRGVSHFLPSVNFYNLPLYFLTCFFPSQPISFPGLDERECVQFLCALKRFNAIAEVQAHTENCSGHMTKHFSSSLADRFL